MNNFTSLQICLDNQSFKVDAVLSTPESKE